MRITEVERIEGNSLADIEELLEGNVFHVTRREFWEAIAACGEIRPNIDGSLSTTFGASKNSYFRKRGCISLFDYRATPTEEINNFRTRCWPFQPAEVGTRGIAILVLRPSISDNIIPWIRSKENGVYDEMIVPHVEAGHPGPISVENIEQIIFLCLLENPDSYAAVLRSARKRKIELALPLRAGLGET